MAKALLLHWSSGGNTEKVADALGHTLKDCGVPVDKRQITADLEVDYMDYELVLMGAPVYRFLPPEPVQNFLLAQQGRADVKPACPEVPGHYGAVFCTYGGPHTGIREAIPAMKYMGQFLEHVGISVKEEWAVVGEFHVSERQAMNVKGRLGDISGRPNQTDLADVRGRMRGLLRRLSLKLDLDVD